MNIETETIISLLKMTLEGPVSHEALKYDARIPSQTIKYLLQKLQSDGLVNLQGNMIGVVGSTRLELAVKAVRSGADLERVSRLLHWQEFEAIAAYSFEHNGYQVYRNVRFKCDKRRYEIDIVGCRGQLVVCADCKHWKHSLTPSALSRIVEEQVQRTLALSRALPDPRTKICFSSKESITFLPTILTLVPTRLKLCDGVPVIPVLQLQDFISEFPCHVHALKHFRKGRISRLLNEC